jgi:ubiquinone/menaquinone biosynthesis C-methylase UbiE
MQPVDLRDYIRMNKRHWDAIATKNWAKKRAELPDIVRDPDSYLKRIEPYLHPYLEDVKGKRVIVLQFGDAHVMMACALKGAEVTGVDLSSEQVRLAGKAAEICGVDVKLVEADCQNLPDSIPSSYFDYAVAECGIFIWIADLHAWMRNANRVLKRGGRLLAQDFHPISLVAKDWRAKIEDGIVAFRKSYLDQSPETYHREDNTPPAVEFTWKISDVINAAIDAGFQIDRLEEFYDRPEESLNLIPNVYLLAATKK